MAPKHPSTVSHENLSRSLPSPLDGFSISQVDFGSTEEDRSITSGAPHVGTSSVNLQSSTRMPSNSQPSQVSEGDTAVNPNVNASTSQCSRVCTMSCKMADSTAQQNFYGTAGMHYMANQSLLTGEMPEDLFHDQHLKLQERMRNPIAFHAKMMGDIMYFQQALQQPDGEHFIKAVIKEVNSHVDSDHWVLVKQDTVPDDVQIVPSVWPMRILRDLTTNEIKSHKACLNLHGRKQAYGMNYFKTYALVVTWFAIRLMIVFGIIFCWSLCQVDFVMAYSQAPIETDPYMELPQGVQVVTGNSKDHVLKLLKNIYGQKQAGRVWNSFLVDKLTSIGFQHSTIDDCVFFRSKVVFMVYVDDGIFIGDNDSQLTTAINKIRALGLKIEDQGHPADYAGVSIKRLRNGSYEFTQRTLIDSIVDNVGLTDSKTKPVPAKASLRLHAFKDEPPFNLDFNYPLAIGKLNYSAQTTHPDIMYATHQIAKYTSDPRKTHEEAILYLARYLMKSRDLGIRFKPNSSKGFECYCDADFSGLWNKMLAPNNPSTAKS
jgi:hypothetical protein